MEYSEQYNFLRSRETELKKLVTADDELVLSFKKCFLSLLNTFGYKSNGLRNIDIKNKGINRLLPSVFISGQESQYIRYVSSASDFVRSIWAYYIALVLKAKRHPGFLILDEPGQHQMRVDSLKSLLKQCSTMDKQVIIAISQDRNYDEENVNINDLLSDISEDDYDLHHIKDGAGCIVEIINRA